MLIILLLMLMLMMLMLMLMMMLMMMMMLLLPIDLIEGVMVLVVELLFGDLIRDELLVPAWD